MVVVITSWTGCRRLLKCELTRRARCEEYTPNDALTQKRLRWQLNKSKGKCLTNVHWVA